MANDLQHFTPEVWSVRTQMLLKNDLVAGAIANTEERSKLTHGDVVHRPYHSEMYVQDYTKGTAVTMQDISTTDETLTVDQTKIIPVYVDDVDNIQNVYKTIDDLTARAAYELKDNIDSSVLFEVTNAFATSSATSLSVANVVSAFSNGKAALSNNSVEDTKPWFAVIDPDTCSIIEQYLSSNGFKKQDDALENGYGTGAYVGDWLGLRMFKSNNLRHTAVLGLATQPTDGDTVTINGVAFTFKTTLGSTAGNVLIGADADAARLNLTTLINTPGTTTAQGVALSAANIAKLKRRRVVATNDASLNTLTLVAAGKMTLAETLTAASDVWGTQTKLNVMGQVGCIDLVIQKSVNAVFNRVSDKLGQNILTWDLYGKKTFNEGAQRMYGLNLNV